MTGAKLQAPFQDCTGRPIQMLGTYVVIGDDKIPDIILVAHCSRYRGNRQRRQPYKSHRNLEARRQAFPLAYWCWRHGYSTYYCRLVMTAGTTNFIDAVSAPKILIQQVNVCDARLSLAMFPPPFFDNMDTEPNEHESNLFQSSTNQTT